MTESVHSPTFSASQNAVLQILVKKYRLKHIEEIRRFVPMQKGSILTPFFLLLNRIIHFVKHFQFIQTNAVKECLQKECAKQLNLKLESFSNLTNIKAENIEAFENCYKQMQTLKKVFSGTQMELGLDQLLKTSSWESQKLHYDRLKVSTIPQPPPPPLAIQTSSSSICVDHHRLKSQRHSLKPALTLSSRPTEEEAIFIKGMEQLKNSIPLPSTPPHEISEKNRKNEAEKGNCCDDKEWEEDEFEDLNYSYSPSQRKRINEKPAFSLPSPLLELEKSKPPLKKELLELLETHPAKSLKTHSKRLIETPEEDAPQPKLIPAPLPTTPVRKIAKIFGGSKQLLQGNYRRRSETIPGKQPKTPTKKLAEMPVELHSQPRPPVKKLAEIFEGSRQLLKDDPQLPEMIPG